MMQNVDVTCLWNDVDKDNDSREAQLAEKPRDTLYYLEMSLRTKDHKIAESNQNVG